MNIPQGTQDRLDRLSTAILERRWNKNTCACHARLVVDAKRRNFAMLSADGIRRINALLDIALETPMK